MSVPKAPHDVETAYHRHSYVGHDEVNRLGVGSKAVMTCDTNEQLIAVGDLDNVVTVLLERLKHKLP